MKRGSRTYNNVWTVKVRKSPGGGETKVEKRVSRSIDEMYKRMLQTGELQNAMMVKSVSHGNAERTVALMENAKVAPNYMSAGEVKKVLDKMGAVDKTIKESKATKAKDKVINELAESKAKDIVDRSV
jgi:hypothetical protein